MLKKRLIGMVTVKNGWAVQSFSYNCYLPLGKPECIVENLDRWGADEILVQVIDRSTKGLGPDFDLLERLGKLGLKTPLIYAGGIRYIEDGIKIVQLGADRIAVDALLHKDLSVVYGLSQKLGAQALIASLPLSTERNNVVWFDYVSRASPPISHEIIELIRSGIISEILVSDWKHEGKPNQFDHRLIDKFPIKPSSIIAFGGISTPEQMLSLLKNNNVVAVAIGNFLSYREHAIQSYKELLYSMPLRHASYESNSLIANTDV